MRRQIPNWVVAVVIVVVVVIVALIYVASGRRGGAPVQPVGTVPEGGQVKGGLPYSKAIPPGAPPFKKLRP